MPYESLIGWRYVYRKPKETGRLFAFIWCVAIGTATLVALFWLLTHKPTPPVVIAFTLLLLAAVAFGLLSVFSVFTTVSVFGVVLGVAALTIVLAVTSGFQGAFQDKVLGVNAHVLVMKTTTDFGNYRDVEKTALAIPEVLAVQPFVFVEMLITSGKGELSGIAMKGVDPDRVGSVLDLPEHMVEGSISALKRQPPTTAPTGGGVIQGERVTPEPAPMIIGRELAHKLHVQVDDVVTLVLPNLTVSELKHAAPTAHPPKTRKFVVKGIFYSGFDEYDRRLVYIDIKEAQDFLGQGDVVMGVEMKVRNVDHARAVARELEHQLKDGEYMVMDWRELNNNLFTALTLQKIALLVFLTLIIIVAAFNMVASLTMMVIDKTKEIAILKSMGAHSTGVAGVFEVVGLTIGAVGTAVGLGLGVLLGGVVARYGYPLDPKVYLIDKLPIQINPSEVVLVGVITMVICFVATLYPALKASGLRPVEGLRYE